MRHQALLVCPGSQQTLKPGSRRETTVFLDQKGQRVRDGSAPRPSGPGARPSGLRGRGEEEARPRGLERELRPAGRVAAGGPSRVKVRGRADQEREGEGSRLTVLGAVTLRSHVRFRTHTRGLGAGGESPRTPRRWV